jgi:hypothetical protein
LIIDSLGKYLVTNPSLSPENIFLDSDNEQRVLCEGSVIDIHIIDAIFGAFIESSLALEISDDLLERVRTSQDQLPPMAIGSYGQLQEWQHDYAEIEPGMCLRVPKFRFYL